MSEFSISKKAGFSCVAHFFRFCFFLLSHPLYFSYFIFFFPYILRLLSFLSPLFVTTFLLLFAFLTVSPGLVFHNRFHSDQSAESAMGFLATTYQVVFDSLRPRTGDEIEELQPLEELEAYKIVFETYTFETGENPYDDVPEVEVKVDCQDPVENSSEKIKIFPEKKERENPAPCGKGKEDEAKGDRDEKEVNAIGVEPKKGEGRKEIEDALARSESKAMENETKDFRKLTDCYGEEDLSISSKSESSPWSSPGSFGRESSLGSYGSMRKEKEWRRTLACKLFEERHNADGTEGMDSLWETYENTESNKLQKKPSSKTKRGKQFEQDDDDKDEEEDREGQLCCLQALKFSAGKMNLGMRRPNLVKMSKALKGFGWLSRHGSKKGLIH